MADSSNSVPTPPASTPAPETTAPQTAGTTASPYNYKSADKKPKTGLILGIIGGIVGLILVIVAAFFIIGGLGVSKEDYREAYKAANEVRSEYTKLGSNFSYISTSKTETQAKNDLDTLNKQRERFDEAIKNLGEEKAIKNDGEAKKLYEALKTKRDGEFSKALEAITEVYEKILPVIATYRDESSSLTSSDGGASAISKVRKAFENVEDLKNDNNKEFVEDFAAKLKEVEELSAKVQEGRDDYKKYDAAASRKFYSASSDLSKLITNWSSNIQKVADEGELKNEINDLGEYITDKTNGKK